MTTTAQEPNLTDNLKMTTPPTDESNQESNDSPRPAPHIVVIDDDIDINRSIKLSLEARGYGVSHAHDGNKGVAMVETILPDLVVLDLMMPNRSGFLVLERLCQNPDTQMPVIVITAVDGRRHQQYAELLGAADYIQKPFPIDRLLTSVKTLLKN